MMEEELKRNQRIFDRVSDIVLNCVPIKNNLRGVLKIKPKFNGVQGIVVREQPDGPMPNALRTNILETMNNPATQRTTKMLLLACHAISLKPQLLHCTMISQSYFINMEKAFDIIDAKKSLLRR